MNIEREELETRVFPELRTFCEKHNVSIEAIDLGWEAVHFDGNPNEALSMCLAHVFQCTYFIGILGECYGSEFENPSTLLLNKYPWLDSRKGRSFVELEFVCGVLGENPTANHSFFYMRDQTEANRVDQNDSQKRKLISLKKEIKLSGAVVREGIEIQCFADIVYCDLIDAITEDFSIGA